MTKEEWRPVVGYEDYFLVSESGKVFSKRTNKEIKIWINKNGYAQFATKLEGRKGKTKVFKIHMIVCEAFNGPRPNEFQIYALHWDDNKLNNHYSNLRWGTLKENSEDFSRNRGFDRVKRKVYYGEDNSSSKLTNEIVKEIIENFPLLEMKSRWQKILFYEDKFKVSRFTIRRIVDGKSWKHLTNGIRLE